jgi:hypothetical protein
VKWEFERRFPARYTASNSPRRTSRASRGKSRRPALYGSEPMTALLAACRKHSAASGGLHARTETVRLGAPALARLIGALWQSNPPYILRIAASQISGRIPQAASAALCESVSVVDPRAHGQESGQISLSWCGIRRTPPDICQHPCATDSRESRAESSKVRHRECGFSCSATSMFRSP